MTTTTHAAASHIPAAAPLRGHPLKHRLLIVLLIAVYPLITALLYVVLPLTDGWALWARTLVIAPIMVTTIVYVVSPRIQRHFGGFIAPAR